jgi:hypothetical protein
VITFGVETDRLIFDKASLALRERIIRILFRQGLKSLFRNQ